MAIPVDPPRPFAALFASERSRLVEVLRSLTTAEWRTPSPCPFSPSAGREVVARLRMTTEQAWRRLLTNNGSLAGDETLATGDPALAAVLLRTRAIIGAPK